MVTKIRSLGLNGISGYEVTAECDLSGGLPAFDKVVNKCRQQKSGYFKGF